ncbi:MAG: hypothetical protein WCW47_01030 [Candidatus Paceibacterota bacterium]|jgi:hypothetical protein
MPPSGYSKKAVEGALQFTEACFEDLLEEVRSGKHKDIETALRFELKIIRKALMKLHITHDGNIVDREPME